MRLDLVGQSIESRIADLQLGIEEIKTRQLTSQDSGMLGQLARAQVRDRYGDVVQLLGDWGDITTSQIQCPATPSNFQLNTIYADQIFIPKNKKPAVAIPLLRLKVDSGGLHGESELFINAQWGVTMTIYDANNNVVGGLGINQSFGGLFDPQYDPEHEYAWETMITYWSNVPFTLSYEFVVRSSDRGSTSSKLRGYWF
jgi:hypothetical protein